MTEKLGQEITTGNLMDTMVRNEEKWNIIGNSFPEIMVVKKGEERVLEQLKAEDV